VFGYGYTGVKGFLTAVAEPKAVYGDGGNGYGGYFVADVSEIRISASGYTRGIYTNCSGVDRVRVFSVLVHITLFRSWFYTDPQVGIMA